MRFPDPQPVVDWIMDRMVNRTDACGGYYRSGGKVMRTTRKQSDERYPWLPWPERIKRHLSAKACDDLLGLHSTSPDQTSKWCAWDIDAHTDDADRDANLKNALSIREELDERGFTGHIFDSNGNGGYHVIVFFEEPAPTHRVYQLGQEIAKRHGNPETFPKQASIATDGYGNWLRLPGLHHQRDHQTKFFNGEGWGTNLWDYLLSIEPDAIDGLPDATTPQIKNRDDVEPHGDAPASAIAKVITLLEKEAPAIEGNGGDDHTIRVCNRVLDHGLSIDQAMIAMADWDRRCNPPWGEELRTKLVNARQYRNDPIGWKTADDSFGQWGKDQPKQQPASPKNIRPKIPEIVANGFVENIRALFPAGLDVFCARASDAIGCHSMQIFVHMLVVLANAIGSSRRIELKKGWTEPPIIWTAVVNKSGDKKTPALNAAMGPLRDLQREAMREHEAAMTEYAAQVVQYEIDLKRFKSKSAQTQGTPPNPPEKPKATRYYTSDSTIEAMACLLKDNPRGVVEVRDELSGLFDFGRYTQSGNAEVARYLEAYNGNDIVIDRKADGATYVPRAHLSLTGTIQDGILSKCLAGDHWENGLAARFLFTKPPRVKQRWRQNNDIPEHTSETYSKIVRRLYRLQPGRNTDTGEQWPITRRLSNEAMDIWADFYNAHAALMEETDGNLAKSFAKLEAYAARFALTWHCADWACNSPDDCASDPEEIGPDAMQFGVDLACWFRDEIARVYAILQEDEAQRRQRELVELIQSNGGSITRRELMIRRRNEYPDSDSAKAALDGLVNAGFATYQPKTGSGRPSDVYTLTRAQNTKAQVTAFYDGSGVSEPRLKVVS